MKLFFQQASKIGSLPVLNLVSPAANREVDESKMAGHLAAQRLAQQAVNEIAKMLQEGWTEKAAADLIETYLRDSGVKAFFHHPFVWYGDRTRFEGVRHYGEYAPSKRVLRPGEVFILDVAPIYQGFIADIGYTGSLGENQELLSAKNFLKSLRDEIPYLFSSALKGSDVWKTIDQKLKAKNYSNVHQLYPFSVLGHRVHETNEKLPMGKLFHFGWQSYWTLLSRGLLGQLMTPHFEGDMRGLWAIEPHLGTAHFGAKFEEILVVTQDGARWLERSPQYQGEFL